MACGTYYLVFNCGSSSIKFAVFERGKTTATLSGIADKINQSGGNFSFKINAKQQQAHVKLSYQSAFLLIIATLKEHQFLECISCIGHRVVHGGHYFNKAVMIDQDVLDKIRALIPLAPLHNPANLQGIEFCNQHFGNIQQVAVFDTAFHQSIPEHIYRYAIPQNLYEELKLRKYGFHGISHQYIAQTAAHYLRLAQGNFICAHLGNGCSITAIKEGKSIDTSMGFTPLDGLVMGTRSGAIDPGVFGYLKQTIDMDIDQINQLLNKQSGLLGICGLSDMRDIEHAISQNNAKAILALEIFSHRIAQYIASYMMYFAHFDGLIFTAGIGEHSAMVRQKVIDKLEALSFMIDDTRNSNAKQYIEIHKPGSKRIMVLPTDEELMIAQSCHELLNK
ncbi:acetate/propionate family kinase [Caedibacter taeniospiralis]|uniref:acetate/propionate family kinase n=1 Tax=Caedibacter taeniospiralis TaxID=28907 RepID=UPI000C27B2F9|nr:acetate kinase [Caedibacter taeniospiralis]